MIIWLVSPILLTNNYCTIGQKNWTDRSNREVRSIYQFIQAQIKLFDVMRFLKVMMSFFVFFTYLGWQFQWPARSPRYWRTDVAAWAPHTQYSGKYCRDRRRSGCWALTRTCSASASSAAVLKFQHHIYTMYLRDYFRLVFNYGNQSIFYRFTQWMNLILFDHFYISLST